MRKTAQVLCTKNCTEPKSSSSCFYRGCTHKVFQNSPVLNQILSSLNVPGIKLYTTSMAALPSNADSLRPIAEKIVFDLSNEKYASYVLKALAFKIPHIYYHSLEVMCLSMLMAQHSGFGTGSIYDVGIAAAMHDIGKIFMPAELLDITKELGYLQKNQLEQVPLFSAAMMKKTKLANTDAIAAIISHQENFIGTGYPCQKMQDEIHPYGMLVHVADDYDTISALSGSYPKCGSLYAKNFITRMIHLRYSKAAVDAFTASIQCIVASG